MKFGLFILYVESESEIIFKSFFCCYPGKNVKQPSPGQQAKAPGQPQQAGKPASQGSSQSFGPFPQGSKGLVQRSPLIKHTNASQHDDSHRSPHDRTNTNTENQNFLNDVSYDIKKIIKSKFSIALTVFLTILPQASS